MAPGSSAKSDKASSKKQAASKQKPGNERKPKSRELGTEATLSSTVPLELQQLLLNIFRNSFPERFGPDLAPLLQEVKQHLYNREFGKAFGREDYLEAYAVRWSPSRALGYLQTFLDIEQYLRRPPSRHHDDAQSLSSESPETGVGSQKLNITCLGGGAGAEIVALAGFLNLHNRGMKQNQEEDGDHQHAKINGLQLTVKGVDIANWDTVVQKLHDSIGSPPPLSKYASAAAKAYNTPFLDSTFFHTSFHQADLLSTSTESLAALVGDAELVTLMFTLNELYTTSLAQTQRFLAALTSTLQPGALLLVVDSPGSYSAVTLNGAEKKYPMHWLLDHTLLGSVCGEEASNDGIRHWEKLATDESRWFRLPDGLKYPIELENMRYQIHLYRRLSVDWGEEV
ncbi:hypothetical protein H2199_007271 [Coniosporium tulheliwenetii]|uniref:Uncharacterized protein n=1 Tax=Coniosporium tulheliwenetii TaxID=3383036 RepID=A0ACC2YRS2_9PEZI|nr:hypothetical protein H2199_007271 [Cladosporium sp. JES 115]